MAHSVPACRQCSVACIATTTTSMFSRVIHIGLVGLATFPLHGYPLDTYRACEWGRFIYCALINTNTKPHITAVRLSHDLPAFLQNARYTSVQRKWSPTGTKPNM
jgi:hypothetical protein